MGAQPENLREIDPIKEEVIIQKKSKKTKKATTRLRSIEKISTGRIGGRKPIMGSVSERRPAKMGGEILTGKPGSAGLRASQLGGGMIEKNKNLIKKHLKMPSRISSLQI